MALTPEQETKIKELLPAGYEICLTSQINELIDRKRFFISDCETLEQRVELLESVFKKLKPLFTGFTGGGDLMSALPQIMPVVQSLQTDKELTTNLAKIVDSLK